MHEVSAATSALRPAGVNPATMRRSIASMARVAQQQVHRLRRDECGMGEVGVREARLRHHAHKRGVLRDRQGMLDQSCRHRVVQGCMGALEKLAR
jgi:hypothetical protein